MVIRVQAKRAVFKPSPYETSRRRKGLPRWVILMLLSILIGASGVLFVQTSYGPKQLSVMDSQKLIGEMNSATLEKQRLQTQVDEFTQKLELERSEYAQTRKSLEEEVSKLQALVEPLREQLNLFAQTLPFDPKYGAVGISTAQFIQGKSGGKLSYLLWVMQEIADRPTFTGQLLLAFEGRHADGRNETISISPINLNIEHYQHITGQADLPEGFVARRVNAKILDADGKKQLTWRVMQVQQK
jgi:uncharacterized protein YpmS